MKSFQTSVPVPCLLQIQSQCSDDLQQLNQKKYEDIYNVVFDNKLNETFYNSYAISNCQEFLYFLHEEVAEKYIMLDEDNSDENYDDYEIQSYEDWLNEEFGDDAETAYWNLD